MRMSHPVSLLIIDIDSLNTDTQNVKGKIEDEALKRVAEALSKTAKRPGDLAGRLDAKEFGIVLAFTPLEAAMQVAEKLRATIADSEVDSTDSEQFNNVLINVGIATTVPTLGSSPEELIAKADRALHLAKMENKEDVLIVN
jgi:diguanylate cyclase (GGDEF)-like protein